MTEPSPSPARAGGTPESALYTIGYEGTTLDAFVAALRDAGVAVLVDVRDFPSSRKPGFSKTPLREALAVHAVRYEHWKALGTPKPVRDALRATGDRAAFGAAYRAILEANEAVVRELAEVARLETACLMCFERNPQTCHRSLLARRILELGLVERIVHLEPRRAP